MAIPKAAVKAIVEQVAIDLNLLFEERPSQTPWRDGFFVKNVVGREVQLVRHVGGGVDVVTRLGDEIVTEIGSPTETQQELKVRLTSLLRTLC